MDEDNRTANFQAELYSEKLKSLKTETITFSSFPETILAIKERVEECCSIPACVQRIFYQDTEVPDNSSPDSLYIRSGDTLRVSYPIEGETKDVKEVIRWLNGLTDKFKGILQKFEETKKFSISYDPIYLSDNANVLTSMLFHPWSDPVKHVNGQHFDALQGVQILAQLHRLILDLKKFETDSQILLHVEYICVAACANFAMSQSSARRLLSYGVLENCIATFLMKPGDDASLVYNNQHLIVRAAMLGIINISELPEVQEDLSYRHEVIKQCFLAANTKMYSSGISLEVMVFLICISRCQKAHQNLLKPELVGDVISLCKKEEEILDSTEIKVLMTYAGVVFAQIICGSIHLLQKLPSPILMEMKSLMQQVWSFDPMELRDYELQNGVYWMTFLNCIEYLYALPSLVEASNILSNSMAIEELHHLSVGILLHYLQSALGRNEHVEKILQDNLMDFVIALPWNVPSGHEDRAKCVVREITKNYPVHPLSLSSLAKAKLAKSTWGLKKIMEIKSFIELM